MPVTPAVGLRVLAAIEDWRGRTIDPARPVVVSRCRRMVDPARYWSIRQRGIVVATAAEVGFAVENGQVRVRVDTALCCYIGLRCGNRIRDGRLEIPAGASAVWYVDLDGLRREPRCL